ncbi:4-phosphopantetheinyl transferase family protein [Aureibaculum sp. A20]|uniref:4-phosphopantetheinyl transferase family protein n=1 Tax=Aureibaculum flavum TaxID=2795986 RepID=A0ABS0WN98_9FLAO|nr:4'-phosphopantetheinyl transferase superfamily protein [Aureibaculum flavum]MBJ2173438.1 4-phosphopantetheinyl transferase family protein [Aureibaculum flavum]
MIGNDVVDLDIAKSQSNWKRNGFLDKVFTKKEQLIINNTADSFTTVWLLWSMKESAYKIYSRQHNSRFFAPKKFECDLNDIQNIVCVNGMTYYTSSTISKENIHTLATLNKDESITSGFFKLKNGTYDIQHNTTYENLKLAVANQFKVPVIKVKIEKNNNGIPFVKYKKGNLSLSASIKQGAVERTSISISHHGLYGAYAFVN